jgi:hypothetical protein
MKKIKCGWMYCWHLDPECFVHWREVEEGVGRHVVLHGADLMNQFRS